MTTSEELHQAVEKGDAVQVRRLLDAGASAADAVSPWGWPLLHVAALRGHLETAQLLWERDERKEPRRLKRALHFALQSGKPEVVRYFVDQGAVGSPAMRSIYLGDLAELRRLLAGGERPPAESEGQTLLHAAADVGSRDAVELLLGSGAVDVDARTETGATALSITAGRIWKRQAAEVAGLLLGHGATLDAYSACVLGRASALATLLGNGTNLGRLMGAAQEAGHAHVARVLVEAGAPLDVFGAAAFGPTSALDATLTEDPARLRAHRQMGGYQPLHCAAETGRAENARLLLDRGADVAGRNGWGFTPLHLAVLGARGYPTTDAHLEIVQALIDRGADVNVADDLGRTPLDVALIGADQKRWGSPSMEVWRRLNPEGLAGVEGDRATEILALLRSR
jgi:ankyrin repeat protein